VCDVLGIEYPIVQSGMGGVAGPELAAEVSGAGGLGIVSLLLEPPDRVRELIGAVRAVTDAPFGANLLFPPGITDPVDPAAISPDLVAGALGRLDELRGGAGLEPRATALRKLPSFHDAAIDLILEHHVEVLSIGLGAPSAELVGRCHEAGTKVMVMVTSVADAKAMDALGVDVIVAQGTEAGGHRSHLTPPEPGDRSGLGTLALVPEIVDAVRCPVLAAGGIVDGRGLVAALALGADGVLMGSRFVATDESIAPELHRKAVLERDGSETRVTAALSGWPARAVANELVEGFEAAGVDPLPFPLQYIANADIRAAGDERGDGELMAMWAGQAIGRVHGTWPAAEVVERTVADACQILDRELPGRIGR
jgi:nitronate monooxygenase